MKKSKISAAATVIMFLSEYIHGEVNGKREELKQLSLDNALDSIVRLYPDAKFVRPVRKYVDEIKKLTLENNDLACNIEDMENL